ncbi:MAG: DUF732 domain-containing protein [Candidatus Dormibacteria bacterium]
MNIRLVPGLAVRGLATLAGCGSPPHAHHRAPPTAVAPTPTPADELQFASDMRTTFSFKGSVSTGDLIAFGQEVCSALTGGTTLAAEVPTVQQDWTSTTPGDAIQMVNLATKDLCSAQQVAQTVTYVVSSSSADVTYGPSGTDDSGTVPMSVTQPLATPQYYSITAQLNGYGSVSCALEVDGVTISSASASGGYNIASCEIDQNPVTNSWENTNSS